MSKAKFDAARKLIKEGRYSQARSLLETLDHPKAAEWIVKLDQMAKPSSQPTRPKTNPTKPATASRRRPSSRQRSGIEAKPPSQPSKPTSQSSKPESQARRPARSEPRRISKTEKSGGNRTRAILLLLVLIVVIGGGVFGILNSGLLNGDNDEPTTVASVNTVAPEATENPRNLTATAIESDLEATQNAATQQIPATETPEELSPTRSNEPAPPLPLETTLALAQTFTDTVGIVSVEALNIQSSSQIDLSVDYLITGFLTVEADANRRATANRLRRQVEELLETNLLDFSLTFEDENIIREFVWSGVEQSWDISTLPTNEEIIETLTAIQGIRAINNLLIFPDNAGDFDYLVTVEAEVANGQATRQRANQIRNRLQNQLSSENLEINVQLTQVNGETLALQWSSETGSWN